MRWADVVGGMRVMLPSGRVAHVMDRVPEMPTMVMLRIDRDARGGTRPMQIDPNAVVPVVFDNAAAAFGKLKTVFPHVEFIREI
jgi:hypothetical protein